MEESQASVQIAGRTSLGELLRAMQGSKRCCRPSRRETEEKENGSDGADGADARFATMQRANLTWLWLAVLDSSLAQSRGNKETRGAGRDQCQRQAECLVLGGLQYQPQRSVFGAAAAGRGPVPGA